ncbi:hypothetical protein FE257_000019 [Aspergillus nanangensis]|uniref:Cytochrome b5 reductase n=1 Tax=Aspergillus nanangensis TaxID=2582783 RepID=A0AAD4CYY5_ASPNN|nr:hypothetical protein FE257_000019 [Aspergillus nanangensis]
MAAVPEYTTEDIAAHNSKGDLWIAVHGKVYDVTSYVRDHPGGADALIEVAGKDATDAYEDVGHSEDADQILEGFRVGILKDATEYKRPAAVRIIPPTSPNETAKRSRKGQNTLTITVSCLGTILSLCMARPVVKRYLSGHGLQKIPTCFAWPTPGNMGTSTLSRGGFVKGFAAALVASSIVSSILGSQLVSRLTRIESGFAKYPPRIKRATVRRNPHLEPGFLHHKDYKSLPLIKKNLLAPNIYRFVFQLPQPTDKIGLPIGQHVAIKATVNGNSVSRSYTPTSNNLDLGRLELVIKCYPDGLLTGNYLRSLKVGDKVQFRGPKGAMRYEKGLCKKIGMIAGGTGITPMYQLIRAICEDDTDTTEIHLIYANRSEEDILLRTELDTFAASYPKNVKIWYMLDHPAKNWAYGKGYVTPEVMREHLPSPSPETKILLCGPPGMVNASKKGLVSLGFEAPGSVSKMDDQVFSF